MRSQRIPISKQINTNKIKSKSKTSQNQSDKYIKNDNKLVDKISSQQHQQQEYHQYYLDSQHSYGKKSFQQDPYELTFKKPINQQYQNFGKDSNKLFFEESQSKENNGNISNTFLSESSSSYEETSPIIYKKMQTISSEIRPIIYNLQSLRYDQNTLYSKLHSAVLNYYYLHSKQSNHKTIEQKHKEYLLELLVKQLQKKLFINGLRYNSLKHRTQPNIQQDYQQVPFNPNQSNQQILKILQPKLIIFEQHTWGLFKRRIYTCFCKLLQFDGNQDQMKNQKSQQGNQESGEEEEQQDLPYSQQFQRSESQPQEMTEQMNPSSEQELQKIRQLITFISQLKRQALETDSQLKRYFLKWKIYLLESILDEYEAGDQDENQQLQQEHLDPVIHEPENEDESGNQLSDQNQLNEIQSQDQKTHIEDQFNEKKLLLQDYLYQNRCHEVWTFFTETISNQRLLIASQRLYEENLLKMGLLGFKKNWELKNLQIQMDQYYEKISSTQDQREVKMADLFFKTNLKTKYFFQLSNTVKQLKSLRKLTFSVFSICFGKIKLYADQKKRKTYNFDRYMYIRNTKILFKAFQGWKDQSVLSSNSQKVKLFRSQKNQELKQYYFSAMKLFYKESLVRQRKARNFYKNKIAIKTFNYLKFLASETHQLTKKTQDLKQYLTFLRGQDLFQNFFDFYQSRLQSHKLSIKSHKLSKLLQRQWIGVRLDNWRNTVLKRQSYRAIEYRLIRLRQDQTRQQILQKWKRQLEKRRNQHDQLQASGQHKQWLVKYYGKLCGIAKDG